MTAERCRDIAHVSAAELRTAVPAETVEFFVAQLGMHEVATAGDSVYLHTWDDYEMFTVKVTAAPVSGIGRTWLRAASPAALSRRVAAIEATGLGRGWSDGECGIGPVFQFRDPDGHEFGLYWDTEWYQPPAGQRPALKNQAARFPGRGANVRRIDHVNYLAVDIPAAARFAADALGAQLTEQIVQDDGVPSAVWYHVTDKSYDLVYTGDWTRTAAPHRARLRPARRHPAGGRRLPGGGHPHRDRTAQARHTADVLPLRLGARRQPGRALQCGRPAGARSRLAAYLLDPRRAGQGPGLGVADHRDLSHTRHAAGAGRPALAGRARRLAVPSIIAGSDRVSVLEHPGKVRRVLGADGERDARDTPAGLARVGEQPGRKPALQRNARSWRPIRRRTAAGPPRLRCWPGDGTGDGWMR
jgi:catechol 2,3-dioxygenase-like lactoylglutathione lyase family enzyme